MIGTAAAGSPVGLGACCLCSCSAGSAIAVGVGLQASPASLARVSVDCFSVGQSHSRMLEIGTFGLNAYFLIDPLLSFRLYLFEFDSIFALAPKATSDGRFA